MQRFIACSLFGAVAAQEICDVCEGREITPGARTFEDQHDCAETIPWCADPAQGLAHCGGTCDVVRQLVVHDCCPLPQSEACDICEGRPVEEGATVDGVNSCADTVDYCSVNVAACGGTCDAARVGVAATCCPPEPCDICQGRPIMDLVLESGYSCEESVAYCTNFACADQGETCEDVTTNLGGACCPAGDAGDAAETGTADDQTAVEQPVDGESADAQPTTTAENQPADTTEQPTERPTEGPTQVQQVAAPAAEEEDGFESGAITAEAKLTAFLIMTVSSMWC